MDYRTQKQVIIGLFTIIVTTLGAFGAALLILQREEHIPPPEAKPAPTKPAFKDIEVVFTELFFIERYGTYDVLAQIKNPNLEYGSPKVIYEFIFFDEAGEIIRRVSGSTFILANQTRYVIKPAMRIAPAPARAELRILSQTWQRLAPFSPAGLETHSISVTRDKDLQMTYVNGVVRNLTPYNLQDIEVNVVLRDAAKNGKIIAAGLTNFQLLERNTAREFRVLWPELLPYVSVDAKVESNFLADENFIRDYAF